MDEVNSLDCVDDPNEDEPIRSSESLRDDGNIEDNVEQIDDSTSTTSEVGCFERDTLARMDTDCQLDSPVENPELQGSTTNLGTLNELAGNSVVQEYGILENSMGEENILYESDTDKELVQNSAVLGLSNDGNTDGIQGFSKSLDFPEECCNDPPEIETNDSPEGVSSCGYGEEYPTESLEKTSDSQINECIPGSSEMPGENYNIGLNESVNHDMCMTSDCIKSPRSNIELDMEENSEEYPMSDSTNVASKLDELVPELDGEIPSIPIEIPSRKRVISFGLLNNFSGEQKDNFSKINEAEMPGGIETEHLFNEKGLTQNFDSDNISYSLSPITEKADKVKNENTEIEPLNAAEGISSAELSIEVSQTEIHEASEIAQDDQEMDHASLTEVEQGTTSVSLTEIEGNICETSSDKPHSVSEKLELSTIEEIEIPSTTRLKSTRIPSVDKGVLCEFTEKQPTVPGQNLAGKNESLIPERDVSLDEELPRMEEEEESLQLKEVSSEDGALLKSEILPDERKLLSESDVFIPDQQKSLEFKEINLEGEEILKSQKLMEELKLVQDSLEAEVASDINKDVPMKGEFVEEDTNSKVLNMVNQESPNTEGALPGSDKSFKAEVIDGTNSLCAENGNSPISNIQENISDENVDISQEGIENSMEDEQQSEEQILTEANKAFSCPMDVDMESPKRLKKQEEESKESLVETEAENDRSIEIIEETSKEIHGEKMDEISSEINAEIKKGISAEIALIEEQAVEMIDTNQKLLSGMDLIKNFEDSNESTINESEKKSETDINISEFLINLNNVGEKVHNYVDMASPISGLDDMDNESSDTKYILNDDMKDEELVYSSESSDSEDEENDSKLPPSIELNQSEKTEIEKSDGIKQEVKVETLEMQSLVEPTELADTPEETHSEIKESIKTENIDVGKDSVTEEGILTMDESYVKNETEIDESIKIKEETKKKERKIVLISTDDLPKSSKIKDLKEEAFSITQVPGEDTEGHFNRVIIIGEFDLSALSNVWPSNCKIRPYFLFKPGVAMKDVYETYFKHPYITDCSNALLIILPGISEIIKVKKHRDNKCPVRHPAIRFPKQLSGSPQILLERLPNTMERTKASFEAQKSISSVAFGYIPCFKFNKSVGPIFSQCRAVHEGCTCHYFLTNIDIKVGNAKFLQLRASLNMHIFSRRLNEVKGGEFFCFFPPYLNYLDEQWSMISTSPDSNSDQATLLEAKLNEIVFGNEVCIPKMLSRLYSIDFSSPYHIFVVGDSWMKSVFENWSYTFKMKPFFYFKDGLTLKEIKKVILSAAGDEKKLIITALSFHELFDFEPYLGCKNHEPLLFPIPKKEILNSPSQYRAKLCNDIRMFEKDLQEAKKKCKVVFMTCYPVRFELYYKYLTEHHEEVFEHAITERLVDFYKCRDFKIDLDKFLVQVNNFIIRLNIRNGLHTCDIFSLAKKLYLMDKFIFPSYVPMRSPGPAVAKKLTLLIKEYIDSIYVLYQCQRFSFENDNMDAIEEDPRVGLDERDIEMENRVITSHKEAEEERRSSVSVNDQNASSKGFQPSQVEKITVTCTFKTKQTEEEGMNSEEVEECSKTLDKGNKYPKKDRLNEVRYPEEFYRRRDDERSITSKAPKEAEPSSNKSKETRPSSSVPKETGHSSSKPREFTHSNKTKVVRDPPQTESEKAMHRLVEKERYARHRSPYEFHERDRHSRYLVDDRYERDGYSRHSSYSWRRRDYEDYPPDYYRPYDSHERYKRSRSRERSSRHRSRRYGSRSRSRSHSRHRSFLDDPWDRPSLESKSRSRRDHRKRTREASSEKSSKRAKASSSKADAIANLWEIHSRECDMYRKTPEIHPDYDRVKRMWFDVMVSQGFSQYDFSLVEHWKDYWATKLETIFKDSWEEKKEKCLALLHSRSIRGRSSSRHSSSSSRSPSPYESSRQSDKRKHKKKKSKAKKSRKHSRKSSTPPRREVGMKSSSGFKDSSSKLSLEELESRMNEFMKKTQLGEKLKTSGDFSSQKPLSSSLPSKKESNNLLDVTTILSQISDRFGALGMSLSVLHHKVVDALKKGSNPMECIDEDAKVMLELIGDKVKRILEEDELTLVQRAIFQEANDRLCPLLESLEKKSSFSMGLDLHSVAKATLGMQVQEIVGFIKDSLAYKGILSFTMDDLMKIYLEVKAMQIKFVNQKPSTSSMPVSGNPLQMLSSAPSSSSSFMASFGNPSTSGLKTSSSGATSKIAPFRNEFLALPMNEKIRKYSEFQFLPFKQKSFLLSYLDELEKTDPKFAESLRFMISQNKTT